MVIQRGEIWWADLDDSRGSAPGVRRPVVVVQSDAFNRSRIGTVVVVAITSNMRLLDAPGNVLLTSRSAGLPRDSVANVSQIVTVDQDVLSEKVSQLDAATMTAIARGVRLVLDV